MELIDRILNNDDFVFRALINKLIIREDGDIFIRAINKFILNHTYANFFIRNGILTKEDGGLFEKAIKIVAENSNYFAYRLIKDKKITKYDLSSELWEKLLNSAKKKNRNILYFGKV